MIQKIFFIGVITILGFIYLNDHKGVGRDIVSPVANENGLVLVELYTSQSCSSCPPADRLLGEIAKQDNIIAIACHVTYWNHLHWEDTLSIPACTNRQRAFNTSQGSNRNYTPQMVVNGEIGFVGSKRGTAIDAIKNATPLIPLTIQKNKNALTVEFPDIGAKRDLVIEIIGVKNEFYQDIPSGENSGKKIIYSHPAQEALYAGTWDGTKKTQDYKIPNRNNPDHIVIIAREAVAGKALAAGKLDL